MNYKQLRDSVQKIVGKTLTNKLASQIIQQTPTGFNVFNKYTLTESNGEWVVNEHIFTTSKIAIAWCIHDKCGDTKAAHKLQDLDAKLVSKQFDIDLLLYKLKAGDDAILQARLVEDTDTRRRLRKEITKCIESAKYNKIKGTSK